MTDRAPLCRRHRFPAEIIAHAVSLYFRFLLSLRVVGDMLAARGTIVPHQAVRLWEKKFGRACTNEIRRRSVGRLGGKWHLDEVVVSIGRKKHRLWRAVDQDGFVLEVLGAMPPQCQGDQASDAQAIEEPRSGAASDDHRQAPIL